MKTKKLLLLSLIFIISGCALFTVIIANNKWNFTELFETSQFETKEHEVNESFSNITINADTADIDFVLNEEVNKVVCYEDSKMTHDVSVSNDTLNINVNNNKEPLDYFFINFKTPKIKIYLNTNSIKNLTIDSRTGDIHLSKDLVIENADITLTTGDVHSYSLIQNQATFEADIGDITVKNLDCNNLSITTTSGDISLYESKIKEDLTLNSSTGEQKLNTIECKNLQSNGTTGDLEMRNVFTEIMNISRTTGDVNIRQSDATNIHIFTDTGDVYCYFLSEKTFDVHSQTGDIKRPKSKGDEVCEVKTVTGDITIEIYYN